MLLYLRKALDSVRHEGLLYKFGRLDLLVHVNKLIKSYLIDWISMISYQSKFSNPFAALTGVSQGSILGLVLFNIFLNDMQHSIGQRPATLWRLPLTIPLFSLPQEYSLDHQQTSEACRCHSRILVRMEKMTINPEKTEAIIFTHRYIVPSLSIKILNYHLVLNHRA